MGGLVLASGIFNTRGHDAFVINSNVHQNVKLLFKKIPCNLKKIVKMSLDVY